MGFVWIFAFISFFGGSFLLLGVIARLKMEK